MNSNIFDENSQDDLMSAAVRFYEAGMLEHCMMILQVLMNEGHREAFLLAGHCIPEESSAPLDELQNKYYEIACEMGSNVGCYNIYLKYKEIDEAKAQIYLQKAKNLGWTY